MQIAIATTIINKRYALDNKGEIIKVGEEMTKFLYAATINSGDYDEDIMYIKRHIAKKFK